MTSGRRRSSPVLKRVKRAEAGSVLLLSFVRGRPYAHTCARDMRVNNRPLPASTRFTASPWRHVRLSGVEQTPPHASGTIAVASRRSPIGPLLELALERSGLFVRLRGKCSDAESFGISSSASSALHRNVQRPRSPRLAADRGQSWRKVLELIPNALEKLEGPGGGRTGDFLRGGGPPFRFRPP